MDGKSFRIVVIGCIFAVSGIATASGSRPRLWLAEALELPERAPVRLQLERSSLDPQGQPNCPAEVEVTVDSDEGSVRFDEPAARVFLEGLDIHVRPLRFVLDWAPEGGLVYGSALSRLSSEGQLMYDGSAAVQTDTREYSMDAGSRPFQTVSHRRAFRRLGGGRYQYFAFASQSTRDEGENVARYGESYGPSLVHSCVFSTRQ